MSFHLFHRGDQVGLSKLRILLFLKSQQVCYCVVIAGSVTFSRFVGEEDISLGFTLEIIIYFRHVEHFVKALGNGVRRGAVGTFPILDWEDRLRHVMLSSITETSRRNNTSVTHKIRNYTEVYLSLCLAIPSRCWVEIRKRIQSEI